MAGSSCGRRKMEDAVTSYFEMAPTVANKSTEKPLPLNAGEVHCQVIGCAATICIRNNIVIVEGTCIQPGYE